MRTPFIRLLRDRGLIEADGYARLLAHVESHEFGALVEDLALDPGVLLQVRALAWHIQPVAVSWLARPVKHVDIDEDACRRLGAVPVLERPLTLAFSDPECALAAHAILPPHAQCLATAEDIEDLQALVFGERPAVEDALAGAWLNVLPPPRTSTPMSFRAPPWAAVDDA